jgi:hypothetical protein
LREGEEIVKSLFVRSIIILSLLIASCSSDDGGGGGNPESTTPNPVLGAPQCEDSSELACNNHSTLFAVAHSFTDPDNTVLYRVNVPLWDLGRGWQEGRNGLFYRATVSGEASICVDPTETSSCSTAKVYVPFNGVRIDSATEDPAFPNFSFIVPVTNATSSTTLTIDACFTNYQGSSFDTEPPCSGNELGWTNVYPALPTPSVGLPSGFPSTAVAQLIDTTTASIPNNGVYPGLLEVKPSTTPPDDTGVQFFYDHLLFFDEDGNPYTNDLFDARSSQHRSMGVLTIDQAAYPVSTNEYRTKYGVITTVLGASLPEKQFFFYTADELSNTAIKVGIAYIYDAPDGCNGHLVGEGSIDPDCNELALSSANGTAAGLGNITTASISPVDKNNVGSTIEPQPQDSNVMAGERENRTILFQSSGGGLCPRVVNPLATALGGGLYGMPNYVIRSRIDDDRSWGRDFPNALYFVLPTAFGNCNVSDAPFCDRPTGTTSYDAYVPHYLDTSNTSSGTLNGGSTSAAIVGGFTLADEYTLGNAGQASENSLLYFDNCGYGYLYSEGTGSSVPLGTRQTLPDAPNNGDTYTYQITNDRDDPIVFGKECCASYYQENMDEFGNTYLEPPVQLDDGFGVFIGAGNTVTYQTLFNDEAIVIYDATTGARLVKLRLNEAAGALYSCNESSLAVRVSATSDTLFDVGIGTDTSGSLKCEAIGVCPFGAQVGLLAGNLSCTWSTSSFLLGLPDWASELSSTPVTIQLRAWGGRGENSSGDGAVGGTGGVAATAVSSDQLTETLYAYVGSGPSGSAGKGGSSTVLTDSPLSLISEPENVTDPSTVGVLLIAGGGGGAGYANDDPPGPTTGGEGAVAIASTNGAASTAGQSPGGTGGNGGNRNGLGGGSGGGDGVGGHGGHGVDWISGSLILPDQWQAGNGQSSQNANNEGSGGGGFGGGAHGQASQFGGGGGAGSWAARASASASLSSSGSPNGRDGGVQLLYDEPGSNGTVTCVTESVGGRVDGVCTLVGGTVFDLSEFPALVGADPSSVFWIQAWGGHGGKGKGSDSEPGGDRGDSGFAQTITTLDAYRSTFGTTQMYVYLGGEDDSGHNAGKGGASTIVAAADLTKKVPTTGNGGNVGLIAAGGGGGSHAQPVHSGHKGGSGGVAIATTSGDASGCGQNGGSGGGSGGHGKGGCDGNGADGGGSAEGHNGNDGIGGFGGPVHAGGDLTSAQGWTNTMPIVGINGEGGNGGDGNGGVGGGGGGGYGGGGGGAAGGSTYAGGGGGGGGSWAIRSTQADGRAPAERPEPNSGDGIVKIVFPGLP